MLRRLSSLLGGGQKTVNIVMKRGRHQTPLQCRVGDNLMDCTNSTVNQDANIFGLCDKQLACTTCRVDIESRFQALPPPSEEELDVLLTTKSYNENSSRMACQIVITDKLEGMVVRIDEAGYGPK